MTGATEGIASRLSGDVVSTFAVVLAVAAITTLVFQRLRLPVVLGYILAGLIVGPSIPVPLVADESTVHALSELGLILLMFGIGLEFSVRQLFRVLPTAGAIAAIQVVVMVALGYGVGRLFHWSEVESAFLGAIIAISSTTIIAKAFDEQKVQGPLRELVFAVLVVEDVIAVLLMVLLPVLATRSTGLPSLFAAATVKLLGQLSLLMLGGILFIPRLVRRVAKTSKRETVLILSIGICFAFSVLARALGYSVALGAFLAGTLVAESGERAKIERMVMPVRDVFAAVFFVSVGMSISPGTFTRDFGIILALTATVVVGKIAGVGVGAFLTGSSVRTSVRAGMSLAQIGEFSFIIAGVGVATGATRSSVYDVAVFVSALTTLLTPWLIRASNPVAGFVDKNLPVPLATFAALYGGWVDRYRANRTRRSPAARTKRLALRLLLDAGLLLAVVLGAARYGPRLARLAEARFGVDAGWTRAAVSLGAWLLTVAFCFGMLRVSRAVGVIVAERVFVPQAPPDLSVAPRRALAAVVQVVVILLLAAPMLLVAREVLATWRGILFLVGALAIAGIGFWRNLRNVDEHVRATAQVLLEALAPDHEESEGEPHDAEHDAAQRAVLERLEPALGEAERVVLPAESRAVGHTLAELDLRSLTGATVLAIRRGAMSVIVPTGQEQLLAGDVLVLVGSRTALEAARTLALAPA